MAARVYCAVLLCLSGCWSSTEAGLARSAVNPGVCPSTKYDAEECTWIRFVSCVDDSDCANNQKCCSNGCGLQCMAPVTEKPGVCPITKYDGVCNMMRPVRCANDSDCADNKKCCSTTCGGRDCMAPVTVKPGVCPITNDGTTMCLLKDKELCASDSECPKNQKCCSTMCNGLDCMTPVTAAVCGLPMDAGPCEAYFERWAFNSSAGKCVSFIYGGCKGNGNRFSSQKECEESCGVIKKVKPGLCRERNYKAVMCPRIRFESCVDDSDCTNNAKCCSNGCGLQCMAPVTVKPGLCRRRKYKAAMCPRIRFVSCVDDSDCANNQKCCSNGCGLQCMVTAKPGVCPIRKYKPVMCPLIRFVSCADDSDCAGNMKCCSNGCGGHACMAPVTAKPGVCPIKKSKPGMCPLMNFMSCVDDSDCTNNEKCCSNGCGLDCMAPVTG